MTKQIHLFDNGPVKYKEGDLVKFQVSNEVKVMIGTIIQLDPILYLDGKSQSMRYVLKVEGENAKYHVPADFIICKAKMNN